eukprot:CAMPEP_0114110426 /NCGR_PEP_ID=MMETSP0043_2-20121206/1304_1 /TAXON_ID=464988 /ORGANISM="Hemiselmis andersenii, Strain CCMP644" /LENGTH=440 /DNA_ID=CAMNT_0001202371 /DNA_START=72 /DNA_END=1392 /DNA_ORIENTATION=-
MTEFLLKKKQEEEDAKKREEVARVAMDAKRAHQEDVGKRHQEKMLRDSARQKELQRKAAVKRLLQEGKDEVDFGKHMDNIRLRQLERKKLRSIKRNEALQIYEESLAALDAGKPQVAQLSRAPSSGSMSASTHEQAQNKKGVSSTRDPNESLKFAINAYFSAPDSSSVTRGAAHAMRDKLLQGGSGLMAKGLSSKQIEQKLTQTFKWMDRDGSGSVEAAEFGSALDRMGVKVSTAAVEGMMREMDADNDGTMDLAEFLAFGKKLVDTHTDASGNRDKRREELDRRPETGRVSRAEQHAALVRMREGHVEEVRAKVRERKEKEKTQKAFVEEASRAYAEREAQILREREEAQGRNQERLFIERERRAERFRRDWMEADERDHREEDRRLRDELNRSSMERSFEVVRRRASDKKRMHRDMVQSEMSITGAYFVKRLQNETTR